MLSSSHSEQGNNSVPAYQTARDDPPPYTEFTFVDADGEPTTALATEAQDTELAKSLKAKYLQVNKEAERRETPQYHLIVVDPVITQDEIPTESDVKHHINTFLKRLYKKCGFQDSPLAFWKHKIQRQDFGVEEKDELWIGLKTKNDRTVSECIRSLVSCLFHTDCQSVVASISEMHILGIRPVPGTPVQQQWDMELLADIREARKRLATVNDSLRQLDSSSATIFGAAGAAEWGLNLSFIVALGTDIFHGTCQGVYKVAKTVIGANGIESEEESSTSDEALRNEARRNLESAAEGKKAREGADICKEIAKNSIVKCCKAIGEVMDAMDLMTEYSSSQQTYHFLNSLTNCTRWATKAFTNDVEMLYSFLNASREYQTQLGARRQILRDAMSGLASVATQAGIGVAVRSAVFGKAAEGISETMSWSRTMLELGPNVFLLFGLAVNTIQVIESACALYKEMKESRPAIQQIKQEIKAAECAAVTLQGVWAISSQTYIFVTRTSLVNGKRMFLSQADENLYKEQQGYGDIQDSRTEDVPEMLAEVLTKSHEKLADQYSKLADIVDQLR